LFFSSIIYSEEVKNHNKESDCWLVVGNATNGGPKVYDVTSYLDDHPGGSEILLDVAGMDADDHFEDIGHSKDARAVLQKYMIGTLYVDPVEAARIAEEKAAKLAAGAGGSNIVVIIIVIILAIIAGGMMVK
jgi:cytochrome b involved in lipid metabolism